MSRPRRALRWLCGVIKGLINNPLRMIGLAGMAFGAIGAWLLWHLVAMASTDPETMRAFAPHLLNAFLAIMALITVIVLTFLGFRKFTAQLPNGTAISAEKESDE